MLLKEGNRKYQSIRKTDGSVVSKKSNEKSWNQLRRIQRVRSDLIGKDEYIETYIMLSNLFKDGRKLKQTKAREGGVKADIIDLVNRRRKMEVYCGRNPGGSMRDCYTEAHFLYKSSFCDCI